MNSQCFTIDLDNSVELALALLAQGDGTDDETQRSTSGARPPTELLDADGWPGDCARLDDAA